MSGITEEFTLIALGLLIICIRVVVRWMQVGPANFQLDDYIMPLSGLVFMCDSIAAYLVGAKFDGLTNSYMTDEQRAALDPASGEFYNRVWGSKIQVLGWTLYALALWGVKLCVAVFYSRLTSGLGNLQIRVRIAYVLLAVTWVVVTLSLLLGCQPMSKFWQIYPDPGNVCQPTISKLYVLIVLIPDVLTDMYLLSIPLPLLWTANISPKKKIALIILFSGVVFVIMAAIIRGVTILTAGPEGAITGSQWACREEFVSIVVANLPIIQMPLRRLADKAGLTRIFKKPTTSSEQYYIKTIGGGYAQGTPQKRHQGHKPSHQSTAWDSDERILEENPEAAVVLEPSKIVVARAFTIESRATPHQPTWDVVQNQWRPADSSPPATK
ncbi:hypothetical protein GQ53DRAFT_855200 [Thozetella sp. PMI_491]|nr:hypothetical protein GQ53DRAFT_855200 [Thozetella sp. PMI_491]